MAQACCDDVGIRAVRCGGDGGIRKVGCGDGGIRAVTCGGGGEREATETERKSSPRPNWFVVRDDQDAGRAAAAVGRGVVAVVVDAFLHPVGTLLGSGDVSEIAKGVSVKDVMGPRPTTIEGDTATVGDVAIVCAACTLNEPVAVVDGEGRLRRVLRREDLLAPARERRNDPR